MTPGEGGQVLDFRRNQCKDFFQGGYGDEALLIELVTLVGLEGLLARCGGLDGQLDQVTNFGFLICTIDNQCRVAIQQKVWTWTKILIPNIRYFVAISRFVAIYSLFGRLWAKTVFIGQKVHYNMVPIVYYTELNLQICNYARKRRIFAI